MNSDYKSIIFDLDGTLADTLKSIAHFANNALQHYGFSEISLDRYRYLVGRGAKNLVKGMLEEVNAPADDTEDTFCKVYGLYSKSYDDNFSYLTTEYEGVSEMLSTLKSLGFKLGVFSNKPHSTTQKLVHELFPNVFDLCIGYREGFERKPNPSVLLDMLHQFDSTPQQCIYVGDTSTDMRTGKSANAFTVGVTWGFRDRSELEEYNADLIIDNPKQLIEFIQRL